MAQSLFFDRAKVQRAMDRGTRRALTKSGAFVRRRMKSSIRKRKKVSQPGQPPSSHEGSLKRLIYFSYDPGSNSVVIGPQAFGPNRAGTLERGGVVADDRGRPKLYRPRPFAEPALEAEQNNIRQFFKDAAIKRG